MIKSLQELCIDKIISREINLSLFNYNYYCYKLILDRYIERGFKKWKYNLKIIDIDLKIKKRIIEKLDIIEHNRNYFYSVDILIEWNNNIWEIIYDDDYRYPYYYDYYYNYYNNK